MSSQRPRRITRLHHALISMSVIAALSACCTGQDPSPDATTRSESSPAKFANGQCTTQNASRIIGEQESSTVKGETVVELSKDILRIFQDKNNNYWFGSDGQGVYRYDGKTITNFTTKDGLCGNRIWAIQEDKLGNIYFTTAAEEGISKFDGRTFTTLSAVADRSPMTEWKLQPDDLWFQGAQDAGVVYRYDGKTLHRLEFPKTKLGDEHYSKFPRSKFPNAIYSPYDVYSILKDSQGNLWFGTACVGVCRFDGNSFTWMTDNGLTDAPVRSILEDKNGNVWFSYSGQASFDGFRTVQGMDQLKEKRAGTIVCGMSIAEDNNGKIWTASYGADVWQYDGKNKTHYPIKDGNVDITLFSIYKDNHGVLWLGSHTAGAFKFNGKTFEQFKP